MNEQTYEQEINLQKILYRVLRNWRKCLIIALAAAVVAGGGNFALKMVKVSSPEKQVREEMNYERELTAYKEEGASLQREIDHLEKILAQQEAYNEASIRMQINPFHEFNASIQFYISTDYQIVPELTYQDIDLSSRIMSAYVTYMQNGDMYQYVLDHLTEKIELRYLQEVFSVSTNYSACMITLSVQGVDEQSCGKMLTYAIEGIHGKEKEILETVGEHELSSINQSAYETVDLDLNTWQKNNRQYVLDMSASLEEKQRALTVWELSPAPKQEYQLMAIVKDSVKKMILGFVIVMALAVMFIAFRYIVSNEVQDAKDLRDRFGLRVIAQIPKTHKKRAWVWVDRMFARMCGLVLQESDAERLIQVAAQSMNAELKLRMKAGKAVSQEDGESGSPQEADAERKLMFIGSIPEKEINDFISGMEWEKGLSVSSVPCILNDPSAVSAVMDADYVILVEKQEESRYSQIEQELERLAAWKKEVLGVIVLGVDGIPA